MIVVLISRSCELLRIILYEIDMRGEIRYIKQVVNVIVEKTEENVYKINELVEKPPRDKAPSNLAIMGRYVLTPDIFDKINETEAGVGGEIQLTDALQKLDSIYGVAFEGRTYDIGNRLEWLKTSIEFARMR